jgi:hypothetical protein
MHGATLTHMEFSGVSAVQLLTAETTTVARAMIAQRPVLRYYASPILAPSITSLGLSLRERKTVASGTGAKWPSTLPALAWTCLSCPRGEPASRQSDVKELATHRRLPRCLAGVGLNGEGYRRKRSNRAPRCSHSQPTFSTAFSCAITEQDRV